jgi:sugar phosphate isomerase/epimerase
MLKQSFPILSMVHIMKVGISSPAFALEPFENTLDSVADHFKLWEIVADLFQLLPDIAEQYKQLIPSYDIDVSVHAPFNDINIASLNPELRKIAIRYLKTAIKTAVDLDIQLITLHPGHFCPTGIYYPEKVYETNRRSIVEIAKFAKDHTITLALENMPIKHWTLGNNIDELFEMVKDTQFGICFDVGHAFIQNSVDGFIENISHVSNLHIHDNNGRRDEHLVLGEGAIDIKDIMQRINHHYSGNVIIECNTLDQGIQSKKYLDKLLD